MNMRFLTGRLDFSGLKAARAAGLLMAATILAGCPASNQAPEPEIMAGKVVIRGSNTIGEELAPQLITVFRKDHPTTKFDVQPKASSYGLAALRAGQCDIAATSRPATKEELDEMTKAQMTYKEYMIGSYSVAVIVNPKNTVSNLSKDQVRDIFTGTVTNWKAVGGADAPIHLFVRDPISGTYLGFQELAMANKAYGPEPKLGTNYTDVAQGVAQDPNGIGYCGLTPPKNAIVKTLSIGGIDPTPATVNGGSYPYVRGLHLYTRGDRETPGTHAFVEFVQSSVGQQILTDMGFVPHP